MPSKVEELQSTDLLIEPSRAVQPEERMSVKLRVSLLNSVYMTDCPGSQRQFPPSDAHFYNISSMFGCGWQKHCFPT